MGWREDKALWEEEEDEEEILERKEEAIWQTSYDEGNPFADPREPWEQRRRGARP